MSDGAKRVDLLLTALMVAAGHLADCKTRELGLASVRGQIKSDAIGRMMTRADPQKPGGTYSATAAEKVVGFDKAFQLHEADEREATARTIRAMGEYEVSRLRAWFAVNSAAHTEVNEMPEPWFSARDHTVQV